MLLSTKSAVWLSLLAAALVLIAGVSDAFVAPSASLPPSASASRGGNTRPSSRSSTSSGCLSMSADGGGATQGKEAPFSSPSVEPFPEKWALLCTGAYYVAYSPHGELAESSLVGLVWDGC